MKTETVMWLFPIMFMLHDFEEILLMQPWGKRYTFLLNDRMPPVIRKMSNRTLNLSIGGFAFAVMIIFISLSLLTLICVENDLFALWTAAVIVYFVHLIVHLGQSIYLRIYVPAVVTSILTGGYSIVAIVYGFTRLGVTGSQLVWPIIVCLVFLIPVMIVAVIAAARFDDWRTYYGRSESNRGGTPPN